MTPGALIQTFYEVMPIVAFFVAGQVLPFSGAVLVLLIATLVSTATAWLYHKQLPILPLASGALVLITGTMTLYFKQPDAIIIADTIWFWGLAIAIVVGFYREKHLIEHMFDRTFAITKAGWRKLSFRWLKVMVLAGAANEYVRITMSPEFWIDYRFTKILFITGFAMYQFRLARKYRIEGEANSWGLRTKPLSETTTD